MPKRLTPKSKRCDMPLAASVASTTIASASCFVVESFCCCLKSGCFRLEQLVAGSDIFLFTGSPRPYAAREIRAYGSAQRVGYIRNLVVPVLISASSFHSIRIFWAAFGESQVRKGSRGIFGGSEDFIDLTAQQSR
jgi:hypothetical protein